MVRRAGDVLCVASPRGELALFIPELDERKCQGFANFVMLVSL